LKTKIIVIYILAVFNAQAQDTSFTPVNFRMDVVKQIADLKVVPITLSVIKDDFVPNGKDSIGIRIYRPEFSGVMPIVYHVHGAGFVAGDLDTHDNICRYLSDALKAIVVAVDYRRSPEYKFPVPFNDTYVVFKWINTHLKQLGGIGKLILIGDNAGANLVASICLKNLKERDPITIIAQVLVNPALDLRKGSVVYKTYPFFIDWYLNENENREGSYVSPLLAKDYSRLPSAIIVVGQTEEIRNDGEVYNRRLFESGVKSSLFIQPEVGHLGIYWDAAHEIALPAMEFVIKTLKELYLK